MCCVLIQIPVLLHNNNNINNNNNNNTQIYNVHIVCKKAESEARKVTRLTVKLLNRRLK